MQVVKRDGRRTEFDSKCIENAIRKAAIADGWDELSAKNVAKRVTERVTHDIEEEAKTPVDIEHIQDIVEAVLMERHQSVAKAYILYRHSKAKLRRVKAGGGVALVEEYVKAEDWRLRENANMQFSLQGLNNYIASDISAEFWLNRIYNDRIRNAHISGDLHIHDLGTLGAYTYFGKEVVVVKINGCIKTISFEQLYSLVSSEETLMSEKDDAWQKKPLGIEVLDKTGWTKVTRLVRKKKHSQMRFLKNRGGRSVIVTDNHPMITQRGETESKDVVVKDDFLYTVDCKKLLEEESLFFVNDIDLVDHIKKNGFIGRQRDNVYFNGDEISIADTSVDGILHTGTVCSNRHVKLTKDFGFFVGLVLSDGYLTYDDNLYAITISARDKNDLYRANKGLLQNGWSGCITEGKEGTDGKTMFTLRVNNRFLRHIMENIFNCLPGSRNKTLPSDILMYNRDFVDGVVSGVLDGDANVKGTSVTLRVVSRSMIEQLAYVLPFLGLFPRDRNCEGVGSRREYGGREIIQNFPLYGLTFRVMGDVELMSEKYHKGEVSTKAWQDETRDAWHQVLNNDETEIPDEYIYDITTETHTLVVNGMWNHNCVGWDLQDFLRVGFTGVSTKISSKPPKHFRTALGQLVNALFTLQGEAAGAQAVSSFDTLLAPFIRNDGLTYKQVKQHIQEFIFNMNVPTRVGFQSPFSNITLDMECPSILKDVPVVIGGKDQCTTYGEYQEEMDILNRAFCEVMTEGDASGRIFTFPIPTVNLHKNFDWESKRFDSVWAACGRYGLFYFANFINSDLNPEDARSFCCRLRLDVRELRKRGGGLFGANPLTGSIGVVTLNLPRIGYDSKNEHEFFVKLEQLMNIAKDSLQMKREAVESFTESGLYPYSKFYLRAVKERYGKYWKNHFGTIGINGGNEACLNLLGKDIASPEGKAFMERVLTFMRDKMSKYQEETGDYFNVESSPTEGTSYRLALLDKRSDRDMIFANGKASENKIVYYTNSTQLPVGYTDNVFKALDHQDSLQALYTGGTSFHAFLSEEVKDPEMVKQLVKSIATNYKLPYFDLTPTFSVCAEHGYFSGEVKKCPTCGGDMEVFSRVVGYYRPVANWNDGKQAEYEDRKEFKDYA